MDKTRRCVSTHFYVPYVHVCVSKSYFVCIGLCDYICLYLLYFHLIIILLYFTGVSLLLYRYMFVKINGLFEAFPRIYMFIMVGRFDDLFRSGEMVIIYYIVQFIEIIIVKQNERQLAIHV